MTCDHGIDLCRPCANCQAAMAAIPGMPQETRLVTTRRTPVERVIKFLEELAVLNTKRAPYNLNTDEIMVLNSGHPTREAVLRAEDLRYLIDSLSPTARHSFSKEFTDAPTTTQS